ncbi:hypothetical protein ABIE78_005799 [Sinorhizobium fredii]|jgi:hypothetical protein
MFLPSAQRLRRAVRNYWGAPEFRGPRQLTGYSAADRRGSTQLERGKWQV